MSLRPELRDWEVGRCQRWYETHPAILPATAGGKAYRADMLAIYPFHPDWFVRLCGASLRQMLPFLRRRGALHDEKDWL